VTTRAVLETPVIIDAKTTRDLPSELHQIIDMSRLAILELGPSLGMSIQAIDLIQTADRGVLLQLMFLFTYVVSKRYLPIDPQLLKPTLEFPRTNVVL